MKKTALLSLVIALLAPALFAAPTDDEVAASFSAVFGVYGAVFLTSMMGQTVPGAEMDMNMETGASSLVFDNVDTVALFMSIGESLDGTGDMPEIPFTHISGSFNTDTEGNLVMDVTLKGGPVRRIEMITEGDDLVSMKADGKNYDHLASTMMGEGM